MEEDKKPIVRESAADPTRMVYATDEWRRGPFGYERVWTRDREQAKTFTPEEAEREYKRELERGT